MIDLATWNLTIPVGTPSRVIDTPRLVGGYSDRYFRSGDTLFFWSPVTGSTTTNSEFPRSELRETFNDGRLRNWTYPQADNALKATLAINQMPSSGRVVIGQIHIYQGKGPLLKIEYLYDAGKKKGDVVAKYRQKPGSDDTAIIIAKDIALNEQFSYNVNLSSAGYLQVSAENYSWGKQLSSSWKDKRLYFKAGVYTQDNTGYNDEGAMATFYKLDIGHPKK
jgi:hypothetical protein